MCGARYAVSCAQAEVRAEMEGWIATGSINGQVFGTHSSSGAVGSDAWTLINEFQDRQSTSAERKK
jgi:hypothetical protein